MSCPLCCHCPIEVADHRLRAGQIDVRINAGTPEPFPTGHLNLDAGHRLGIRAGTNRMLVEICQRDICDVRLLQRKVRGLERTYSNSVSVTSSGVLRCR